MVAMKFFTGSTTFKFSWDQVAIAFWQRYPNPNSKHVLSEDVISREVIGNKLVTKRLLSKTNPLPRWGERFVGGMHQVYIVEESVVDLDDKSFTTYTRNIGRKTIMNIEEKCVYRNDLECRKFTACQKMAWIESSLYGFSRVITAFGFERFKKNINKANKGFEYVLDKLYPTECTAQEQISSSSKDKLKDKARKAKEIAKEKASRQILTPSQVS